MNWLDRVRAGLREHEDARDEVAAGETSGAAPVEPAPAAKPDEPPATIGPHKVVGVLGRGGVGVVYVARNERLDRLVAVKVLRVDRGRAPELVERFDIEARAAARLRHPNIVGIHEVGEDAGRQYLVMELIPGRSLAARLRDDGPMAPRDAARATERVARALAYAHARWILHRDIKPANVLMTETGEPMLTDFGMAKLFGRDELESPTVSGQVMGTPAYMPPEQARGEHGRVDRRSDVYSLGATLYEMLTNRPPWTAASVMAILGQVTSLEPVSPPSTWAPGLDPDLETICLKCLEKEPGDRYLTADALADDLARWLADEPIVARRPSLAARGRKWLRRNRTLTLALASAVGCALLVLVAGTVGFVERLGQERDRADGAAAEAARQAERARARAAVAQDALRVLIFEVRDELGDVSGERVRRVRGELLEHALGALEQLRDAGLADGSLLQAAEAQRQIGELRLASSDGGESAAAAFEQALALSRDAVRAAPDDPDAHLDLVHSLSRLSHTLRLSQAVRARALADEALAVALAAGRAGRGEPAFEVMARRNIGILARDAGDLTRAAEQLEAAAEVCRACEPPRRAQLGQALVDLAAVRSDQNDLPRAVAAYDEALTCVEGDDRATAHLLGSLASVLSRQGDLESARTSSAKAIDALRALLAADPTEAKLRMDLAEMLNGAASVERRTGDDDAEARYVEESAAILRGLVREEPDNARRRAALGSTLINLARSRLSRRETAAALDAATEAVEALRVVTTGPAPLAGLRHDLNLALVQLGRARARKGDLAGALTAHEEAVAVGRALVGLDATSGRDLRCLAAALEHVGSAALEAGRPGPGLAALDESLAIVRRLERLDPTNLDDHEGLVHALRNAGDAHRSAGQLEEGRPLLEEGFREAERLVAREPARRSLRRIAAHVAVTLGELLLELGDHAGALPAATAATVHYRALADASADDRDRKDLALALGLRAAVLEGAGDLAAALESAVASLTLLRELATGDRVPGLGRELLLALHRTGALREALGQAQAAVADLEAAVPLARALASEDGASVDARSDLARALVAVASRCHARGDLEQAAALFDELLENHRALVALAPERAGELAHVDGSAAQVHLELAYALLQRGDHPAAAAHFGRALDHPVLRGDLARGNLYNAACAAARADLRARALEWLADDLARQRAHLARADEELSRADLPEDRRAAVERLRARILEHVAHARRDPDLACLHGTPEFEALLPEPAPPPP